MSDEGAGDVDAHLLDNDTVPEGAGVVTAVNGDADTVGTVVTGSNGGRAVIAADGSLDFDAAGDFDDLAEGETHETTFTYTLTPVGAGQPARSITTTFDDSNGFTAQITVTEVNGTLVFQIDVLEGAATGDLRGLFFHLADESLLADLRVQGEFVNGTVFMADNVLDLGNGANMKGTVKPRDAFDAGIELGVQGMALDDLQSAIIILSHADKPIMLDTLGEQSFGLRVTSVGAADGKRDGSLMLLGEAFDIPPLPPVPSETATVTVIVTGVPDGGTDLQPRALDDVYKISAQAPDLLADLTANDVLGDGDLQVTGLQVGAVTLLPGQSISAVTEGGRATLVLLTSTGQLVVDGDPADFADLAPGESDQLRLKYTVEDADGDPARASVVITILPGTVGNREPLAIDDSYTLFKDIPQIQADLTLNDLSGDGLLSVVAIDIDGTDVLTNTMLQVVTEGGREMTLSVSENGQLRLAGLPEDFADLAVQDIDLLVFKYTIRDQDGDLSTATVRVTITGDGTLDIAPDAVDDTYKLAITNPSVTTSLLLNDIDGNGPSRVTRIDMGGADLPVGVKLSLMTDEFRSVTLSVSEGGIITLTGLPEDFADLGDGQSDSLSFGYTIADTDGDSDRAIVTIRIDGRGVPTIGAALDDGDDVIFGDLGNDWIVGGTGSDHLWGGFGDDLLNADDDLNTQGGLNLVVDEETPENYDLVFGGAGRDVLLANTKGDRLIDWSGEFNTYNVPQAAFGQPTVIRNTSPGIQSYLYDVSEGDGADPTRAAETGSDADRNGEPFGEIGLVTNRDADWRDQKGQPNEGDTPGNNPQGEKVTAQTTDAGAGTALIDLTATVDDTLSAMPQLIEFSGQSLSTGSAALMVETDDGSFVDQEELALLGQLDQQAVVPVPQVITKGPGVDWKVLDRKTAN